MAATRTGSTRSKIVRRSATSTDAGETPGPRTTNRIEIGEAARADVRRFAEIGVPHVVIARILGVSISTLRRRCRGELDAGVEVANARIALTLFETAMAGNTTALLWWEKTRAGRRELAGTGGTIGSDDLGSYCEFYFDGAANAAVADATSPIWEIAELFADGKALLLTGPVFIAEAGPVSTSGDAPSSAYDDAIWSPARDAIIVSETGARGAPGTPGRDAPTGERSSTPVNGGFYPNAAHPVARTCNSVAGHNDLYTVPSGRKAIFFEAWITNATDSAISWYPELKVQDAYVRLASTGSEGPGGIGHNFGSNGSRMIPIVLNAGETLAINSDTAQASFWLHVIEFDDASPLARADIGISAGSSWIAGDNTLPIVIPEGATIGFGTMGVVPGNNNPNIATTSFMLINGSTTAITYTGPYVVPAGSLKSGTPGSANQFGGTNTVFGNGGCFAKYFPGGLAPGDSIVINSTSAAAGQVSWINYWLF